jgi:feruloyl-CoA synthase
MELEAPGPMRAVRTARLGVDLTRRADGALLVRPRSPIGAYPSRLTERLAHWATQTPDQTLFAARNADGTWRRVSYAQGLSAARRLGQALLDRGLSADRPLMILSGNAIDHGLLGLAALHVGIPYCPVSPAYSLMSRDFGKLRYAVDLLTPGLVYAEDGAAYGAAIAAAVPDSIELVVSMRPPSSRPATGFDALLATTPTPDVDAAHQRIDPDEPAKFLLTSGSTGLPKAVINTQRMLCSNQVMIRDTLQFLADEPPVILDWLPWNNTFGGNHNVGITVYNGGTLHIDDGRPTPDGIAATVRNLREIAPTIYFNVPKGYESLVPHLTEDAALRHHFFSRLQANFYAGAGLPAHVWAALDRLALSTIGARVPMLTGLGATETAPFALSVTPETSRSGRVGLPVPGLDLKLVPANGKLDARVKGPNVTPGYWRQPEATAAAFDEEGYYRMGDALRFVDADDVGQGFAFDGRLSEDFKLTTGTWVSVGPLRARVISACAPFVRDAVLAGADRDHVTALILPDLDACRAFSTDLSGATQADLAAHAGLRHALLERLKRLAADSPGSSTRITRAIVLETPPSIDLGEVTDKGSINQRAVLTHRARLVEDLYAADPPARVLRICDPT